MDIRPLHDRIVVKRLAEPEKTGSGIVIPDSAREKPMEGEVLAVGLGKRNDAGQRMALDVKVGDRVLFGKYAGNEVTLHHTDYLIIREEDVLGVLPSTAAPQSK